jgi:hypothetical protein
VQPALKTLSDSQCKNEILARVRKVRADSVRRWGRMNAAQMICHLNDSLLCGMGEMPVSIDTTYRARKFVKWVGLEMPFQWPHGVRTRPEVDQLIGGTPPGEFENDLQRQLSLIERFTAQPRDFDFAPHPIFLEMNEREWMRWGYLHTDHHLRQFGA